MHIRCPHCRNAIELVPDAALDEIVCPSCGSRFSLVQDSTVSYPSHDGRRIAQFELIESLGMGAFGTVWRARDTKLNREVAVKIPRREQLSPSESERFLREARAAAQLKHPNIVAVHEVGRDDETIYIVSEFVKGVTLSSWLSGHQPTQKEAAELCAKITDALHHAHEAGVVHRDLKPSNVMLDGNAEPHILDFGLAKRDAGEITMTLDGRIFGTPAYMSPEQATGRGHQADRRADVYSLGIILFQLLTGELPFRGDTQMLLHQVANEEPPSPRKLNSRIAKDLETICLRCLEKKPERRYGTAKEVGDDLRRWLRKEPIKARPIGRVERTIRWSMRNPALAGFVTLLGIAAVGFAIATASILYAQRQRTLAQIDSLLNVEPNAVPTILENLKPFHSTVAAHLKGLPEQELTTSQRWRVNLALLPDDEGQLTFLQTYILEAPPADLMVIRDALYDHRDSIVGPLWSVLEDARRNGDQKLRAACVLAKYDSTDAKWGRFREDVVTALVSVPPMESKPWIAMLRPVGTQLVEPLQARYRDRSPQRDSERPLLVAALAEYLRDQPKKLMELIVLADNDREFQPFLEALRPHRSACVEEFRPFLSQSPPADAKPEIRDGFWKKQANAAVCLLGLGEREVVWPLLKHSPQPSLRSFIIDRLTRLGTDSKSLSDPLEQETDASARQALILALGDFDVRKFSTDERQKLVVTLSGLYRHDPDSGVHSAVEWTLRQYQAADALDAELQKESATKEEKDRKWFINSQGQTFVVVDVPVKDLATPIVKTIPYRFAMATHEVTVEQFQKFRSGYKSSRGVRPSRGVPVFTDYAPQPDCPANGVSWYDGAAYCNWLSQQEGIPKVQWCYEVNDKGDYAAGMQIAADYVKRTGYRLPTEAEWEYDCRASTNTSFSFGDPEELLRRYAWYYENSHNRTWPVGRLRPNALGMFDMHGNAWEWCLERFDQEAQRSTSGSEAVRANQNRVLRGGMFGNPPLNVSSANRYGTGPANRGFNIGFRPARTYP
jgi:formylglycine-generating enzyme required for sulfatase activity/tRNA A-37 threonylcarbamoyl transferase component Bud32